MLACTSTGTRWRHDQWPWPCGLLLRVRTFLARMHGFGVGVCFAILPQALLAVFWGIDTVPSSRLLTRSRQKNKDRNKEIKQAIKHCDEVESFTLIVQGQQA